MSELSSFPVGSSVILQNLQKGQQFNEKKGIVKSQLTSGRQEVYVFEAQKSMSIRPINLKYEPRELSSLSVSEMKSILRLSAAKNSNDENADENNNEWTGMDKSILRGLVREEIGTEDPIDIAKLVAKANEPKNIPPTSSMAAAANTSTSFNTTQLREGAKRMADMGPDALLKQAATMKAMGPAALRAMNPQMARMSDGQINTAIAQMEAMANNPSQMKMTADQMKNMSESELSRAVNSDMAQGGLAAAPSSTATTGTNPLNISKSQFQQATEQLNSMTPDQLKQQATMLKSMPKDTLRRTNPQMANMTDAQIDMSIAQLEQMADNPEMVKMASDQMKNIREEDFEQMRKSFAPGAMPTAGAASSGGSENGTTTAANNNSNNTPPNLAGIDPSNMMSSLLSNPDQLNTIVKTMKSNPGMMKSMLLSQMEGKGSEAQKEQFSKAIDSFVQMDDDKLDKYLKVANGFQRVAKPVVTTFDKMKQILGVSTKTLVVIINLVVLASFVGLARWWMLRKGSDDIMMGVEDDLLARSHEEVPVIAVEDEF